MKKLLVKIKVIDIPYSAEVESIEPIEAIEAQPEKWVKDDLEVFEQPMTEFVPAISEKWVKEDLVVFENPLDETFTHHPEVPEILSVLDSSYTYHPAIEAVEGVEGVEAIPEVLEVLKDEIIAQTQGSDEDLAQWLAGDSFKYPEGYWVEYIDLEQDYDYLLAKCHSLRASEYPSLGDQADAAFKSRQGDNSQQLAIDTIIEAVKAKYPKPQAV
jgi:hypothetical protein